MFFGLFCVAKLCSSVGTMPIQTFFHIQYICRYFLIVLCTWKKDVTVKGLHKIRIPIYIEPFKREFVLEKSENFKCSRIRYMNTICKKVKHTLVPVTINLHLNLV